MGYIYNPQVIHRQKEYGKQYRRKHNWQLPDNFFWNDLRNRFLTNEKRFTKYHPIMGSWLRREQKTKIPYISNIPDVIQICDIPIIANPPPDHTYPINSIPEPSTIIMFAIAVIVIYIFKLRNNYD